MGNCISDCNIIMCKSPSKTPTKEQMLYSFLVRYSKINLYLTLIKIYEQGDRILKKMIKITTGEQNVFATNIMTLTRQIIIGNPRYNSKIIINVLNYENFHKVCGSLHCIYTCILRSTFGTALTVYLRPIYFWEILFQQIIEKVHVVLQNNDTSKSNYLRAVKNQQHQKERTKNIQTCTERCTNFGQTLFILIF